MQALAQPFCYIVMSVRAALPHTTAEGGSSFSVVSAVVKRRTVAMAAPLAVWSKSSAAPRLSRCELRHRNGCNVCVAP